MKFKSMTFSKIHIKICLLFTASQAIFCRQYYKPDSIIILVQNALKWLNSIEKNEEIAGYFKEFPAKKWPIQNKKTGEAIEF